VRIAHGLEDPDVERHREGRGSGFRAQSRGALAFRVAGRAGAGRAITRRRAASRMSRSFPLHSRGTDVAECGAVCVRIRRRVGGDAKTARHGASTTPPPHGSVPPTRPIEVAEERAVSAAVRLTGASRRPTSPTRPTAWPTTASLTRLASRPPTVVTAVVALSSLLAISSLFFASRYSFALRYRHLFYLGTFFSRSAGVSGFRTGKRRSAASRPRLPRRGAAARGARFPTLRDRVAGYTDDVPSTPEFPSNLELSLARAAMSAGELQRVTPRSPLLTFALGFCYHHAVLVPNDYAATLCAQPARLCGSSPSIPIPLISSPLSSFVTFSFLYSSSPPSPPLLSPSSLLLSSCVPLRALRPRLRGRPSGRMERLGDCCGGGPGRGVWLLRPGAPPLANRRRFRLICGSVSRSIRASTLRYCFFSHSSLFVHLGLHRQWFNAV